MIHCRPAYPSIALHLTERVDAKIEQAAGAPVVVTLHSIVFHLSRQLQSSYESTPPPPIPVIANGVQKTIEEERNINYSTASVDDTLETESRRNICCRS